MPVIRTWRLGPLTDKDAAVATLTAWLGTDVTHDDASSVSPSTTYDADNMQIIPSQDKNTAAQPALSKLATQFEVLTLMSKRVIAHHNGYVC